MFFSLFGLNSLRNLRSPEITGFGESPIDRAPQLWGEINRPLIKRSKREKAILIPYNTRKALFAADFFQRQRGISRNRFRTGLRQRFQPVDGTRFFNPAQHPGATRLGLIGRV